MARFGKVKRHHWPLWISLLLGSIAAISLAVQLANTIRSPDLFWHMLHGRQFLESGSLIIDHSIFTWTPAASYFPYTGWLAQIILYLTYEFAGNAGLMALRYSVFFLFFLLGWRYASTRGIATNPITWAITIIALSITWQGLLIKTELFTVGFFAVVVWLYFHMRHKGDRAWRLPYLLPLLLVIWINMHGAFIIASMFFVAAAIGEILNSKFCPNQAMPPRLKKHFFIALALCFPAMFITPFGYDLPHLIISEILTQKGFHARIAGYIPTYRFNVAPYYLLDYMILAMLLFVLLIWQKLKLRKTDWVVILVFLGYSAIFTQLARVTYFLGPVLLFTCLDLLAEKKDSWAWPSSKTKKNLLIILCISITALIGWRSVTNNSCVIFSSKESFDVSNSFPKAETEYIKKNLSGKKIGNMYRDGGYLQYHLWPEKQVMIDTRYFPFREWIFDYFSFVDGTDMDRFVKNYPADYWLVNYRFANPLSWFNQSDEWKLAFIGPVGAIFVPAESAPERPEMISDIRSRINLSDYSFAFRAAMELQNLAFAKLIVEAAQDIHGLSCDEHAILTREMGDSIAGIQAYIKGNYEESVRLLEKKTKYIVTQGKAADGLLKLAEQSWDQGDIAGARNWYLKVFNLLPKVSITDIYNFSLLDWHFRQMDMKDFKKPSDDLHWQRLVAFILLQEDEMLPAHRFILETAQAMKDGRYDGKALLMPREKGMNSKH